MNEVEVVTYNEGFIDEIVKVFNKETATDEFVANLTPSLFRKQIVSKDFFMPEGCFIALEKGRAIGFALTGFGINKDRTNCDRNIGVIDGLFFPSEKFILGEKLLERCIDFLKSKKVKKIYGFASLGGYPFWRGIYCGAEPVCLTHYYQAWVAFIAKGFKHHQQSINYLGTVKKLPFDVHLEYIQETLDVSSFWARNSWKNHNPKIIRAKKQNETVGQIGWVEMPYLSEYRQHKIAGIYSLHVTRKARKQGIATSLMGYLYTTASNLGIEEILVGTTVQNIAARKTYEKAGMHIATFRSGTMLEF